MATQLKNLSDFSDITIPSAKGYKFGIVVAQWNAGVTGALLNGAYKLLTDNGAAEADIAVIEVPGSFELTSGAAMLLNARTDLDAVICLGCVIQGETPHFTFICDGVANGITQLNIKYNKPVIFGVLTTDNLDQAKDRSGGKHGNKGDEAAVTAIQMVHIKNSLK